MPRILILPAFLPALLLALACAACGQSPPPDPAQRAMVPSPGPVPAKPTAEAADVSKPDPLDYTCDDGSTLRVQYVAEMARVELPDGRVVALPKAQSASKGGGEVFVGEALSLQRNGDGVQLYQDEANQDEGKPLLCRSSEETE